MNLTTGPAGAVRCALLCCLLAVWLGLAGGGSAWAQAPKPGKGAEKSLFPELTQEQLMQQEQMRRQQQQAQARRRNQWIWITLGVLGGGAVIAVLVVVVVQQQKGGAGKSRPNPAAAYRQANLMMTGQTSQVWEVVEIASGRHFAMKQLLPENTRSPEHRRMLFHEAAVGQKLAHPNIIKIMQLVRDRDNPFFIMEFFPAGSVKLRIVRKQIDFLRAKTHDILRQTATALAYMNASGWVHRDVKPDNMLANSAGEVRLIDFALAARAAKRHWYSRRRGRSMGTRTYMSPEQIRGEPVDGRADIYSFGVSAYELVALRPPFRGQSAQELLNKHINEKPVSPQAYNPDVTDEFAALVLRCLAKKREDRPKDFHEILMQLRNIKIFKSDTPQKAEAQ